jgi:hypothetical protein
MTQTVDTNSVIGTLGTILTLTLSQVNAIVSLAIGIVTLFYMIVKTAKLIKDTDNGIQRPDTDKK